MTKRIMSRNLVTTFILFIVVLGIHNITAIAVNNEAIGSIHQKILVLNYDPVLENKGNIKLHQLGSWWNDPRDNAARYISDFKEFTNGYINYEIVNWIELDEYPRSKDGFMYDDKSYLDTFNKASKETKGAYWTSKLWHPSKLGDFDYDYIINKYNIVQAIQKGEIDEVWMFSGPCMGVGGYESQMVGKDAYPCNSPPIVRDDCRPFVIYGFSYERGTDCMLENAGHRMESTMSNVFGGWDYKTPLDQMNKWEKFTLYDKVSPGNAACGNVHYAPNSTSDYDWGNKTKVTTNYVDWLKYPQMTGEKVVVDSSTWGSGDMRLHHKWWFNCMPKTAGYDEDGYYNNWWRYFAFPTERTKVNAPKSVRNAFKVAIETATKQLEGKTEGTAAGNISQLAKNHFQVAIDKAKSIKDTAIVSQQEVDAAQIALRIATVVFHYEVVKAPEEEKLAKAAIERKMVNTRYVTTKAAIEITIATTIKDKKKADYAVLEAKNIFGKVKTKVLKNAASTLLSAAQAAVDKAVAERALAEAELEKALADKELEEAKIDFVSEKAKNNLETLVIKRDNILDNGVEDENTDLEVVLPQKDEEMSDSSIDEVIRYAVDATAQVRRNKSIADKAGILEKKKAAQVGSAIKVLAKAGIKVKSIAK